ncbi:MAG TPA: PHB depolymerase family esterase [Acidimicrobiales bacterium]|nr:PHB depolymerase family esterase [Acidimicrobiales bacterium]
MIRSGRSRIGVAALSMALTSLAVLGVYASTSSPSDAATATGCSSPHSSATLSLEVNGFTRSAIVHLPKGSSDATPLALVLNLHGSGSTAYEQMLFTGMNKTSNHDDFIVAYPQGLIRDGTGYDWNVPGVPLIGGRAVPKGSPNDISFLTKLVGILETRYCVNKDEVYATGFSGGAREASQLACDDSGLFAAVAPVSGLRRADPCPTTRAVPLISFHGSADPVDPFDGHGQAYWTYSVPSAAMKWAKQDGCSASPTTTTPAKNVKLTTYDACANNASVELYEVMGEGHEWPGGPAMPSALTAVLGPQSRAISANNLMWAFFVAHPLTG